PPAAWCRRERHRTARPIRCVIRVTVSCRAVPLDQLLGDDDPLHLVGPLADAGEGSVAVEPLDVEFLGVAVGAVNTHALDRVLERGLAGEKLRHPGLHVAALAAVEGLCRIYREQPRGAGPRRHFPELELDRLMFADRLAGRLGGPG